MKSMMLEALGATLLLLATLTTREADARLPPKLLKAATGASKALYARGYGYSVIPIPHKILLQTNVARREVHHPRPPRRAKRPRRGKRPPSAYAPRYQDYRPSRKRRPPPPRDPPDYHDQQELDEDFEYDDRHYKEFDDFVGKHSELYADGYKTRVKPPKSRYKDEEGAYAESSGAVYVRRRPHLKNWPGSRPSTKLYSASIALPSRYHREENDYEDEESNYEYSREKDNRGRYRDEDDDRYSEREEEPYFYKDKYADFNPDDYYHDRKYQAKTEAFRRAAENKRPRLPSSGRPKVKSPPVEVEDWKEEDAPKFTDVKEMGWKAHNYVSAYDKNRWKNVLQQEAKWNEPIVENVKNEGSRQEEKDDAGQREKWRTYESPIPLGLGQWMEPKRAPSNDWKEPKRTPSNDWKEPDIITKQNAGLWEERRQSAIGSFRKNNAKEDANSWVKEHSVGYEIEIEGGQKKKKVENTDPDVVYGQSGYTKPRVPDLGYGQGMELVGGKVAGRQVYFR